MISFIVTLVVQLYYVYTQEKYVNYNVTLLWVAVRPESPPGWGAMCVSHRNHFPLYNIIITGLLR